MDSESHTDVIFIGGRSGVGKSGRWMALARAVRAGTRNRETLSMADRVVLDEQ
jgi:2-phosphoglycerate kinase